MFPSKQKTMAEGKDYCERKIALLKSNYDQLLEVCFYNISHHLFRRYVEVLKTFYWKITYSTFDVILCLALELKT